MLKKSGFSTGKLLCFIYEFETLNDEIEMHEHTENCTHIIIVLNGKVQTDGPGFCQILNQGDVYDYKINEQQHRIIPLIEGSRIMNVIK